MKIPGILARKKTKHLVVRSGQVSSTRLFFLKDLTTWGDLESDFGREVLKQEDLWTLSTSRGSERHQKLFEEKPFPKRVARADRKCQANLFKRKDLATSERDVADKKQHSKNNCSLLNKKPSPQGHKVPSLFAKPKANSWSFRSKKRHRLLQPPLLQPPPPVRLLVAMRPPVTRSPTPPRPVWRSNGQSVGRAKVSNGIIKDTSLKRWMMLMPCFLSSSLQLCFDLRTHAIPMAGINAH